jgi:hypothetical protein
VKKSRQKKTKSEIAVIMTSIERMIDSRFEILHEKKFSDDYFFISKIKNDKYNPAKNKFRKALIDYIRNNINKQNTETKT